jgi:hypothetical protein
MKQMEYDLMMRASSIKERMNRTHILKLNMMISLAHSDISELIEQHNELINLYHHELSQHEKKFAEHDKVIGQIHAMLSLYFKKQKENKVDLIES